MVMPYLMDYAVDNSRHFFKEQTAMQVVRIYMIEIRSGFDSYTNVLQRIVIAEGSMPIP
ncbi:hypothetical protein BH18THE2_BH18THE2_20390 [soil metagenome]